MGYYWRKGAHSGKRRILRLTIVALFHIVALGAAAVLSSKFYSTSPEVIVKSNGCGFDPALGTTSTDNKFFADQRAQAAWSLNYARNCYSNATSSQCKEFATRQIFSTVDWSPCPFSSDVCLGSENGAVQVDSGFINTGKDLGINTMDRHTVNYRRTMTCAPLQTTGFFKQIDQTLYFYYGPTKTTEYSYSYTFPGNDSTHPAYNLE